MKSVLTVPGSHLKVDQIIIEFERAPVPVPAAAAVEMKKMKA